MMTSLPESHNMHDHPQAAGSGLAAVCLCIAAVSAVAVTGALLLEHVWGYMPCDLCLKGRIPHYLIVPTAITAHLLSRTGRARPAVLAVAACAIVAALGLALSIYQAGIEWSFWPGPAGCSAPAASFGSTDLLSAIDAVHPPSCGEAALRVLGMSLAGWNAVVLAIISGLALTVLRGSPRPMS